MQLEHTHTHVYTHSSHAHPPLPYHKPLQTSLGKEPCRKKRSYAPRVSHPRSDPKTSVWYRLYLDQPTSDPIWDPASRKGQDFRRKFRVPYEFFLDLVSTVRSLRWFTEAPDCAGRPAQPLPLKILAVLRVLGCNTYFHLLTELTGISEEVHRVFFKKFIHLYATEIFPEACAFPSTHEALEKCMKEYTAAGLAGAFCSTDCVHFRCVIVRAL